MACLMHDIGNPPFGHFGEAAINDWFRQRLARCGRPAAERRSLHVRRYACGRAKTAECAAPQSAPGSVHFEGNAQGIRWCIP
jgi:dGTPase